MRPIPLPEGRGSPGSGPRRPLFTISRKIAAGYFLSALFSVVAIAYALSSLHEQTSRSQHLVSVEFESLSLLRELRQHLLAQETLEKQSLILQDSSLLQLLEKRQTEFSKTWRELSALTVTGLDVAVKSKIERYAADETNCQQFMLAGQWSEASECSREVLVPLRNALLGDLARLVRRQEEGIDRSIVEISVSSDRAYRLTWFLALLGFGLSAPVGVTVLLSLHRSIKALVKATQEIASGRLGYILPYDGRDEFGLLAREFSEMGRKLREMEQACLDANPLTRLPGNLAIDREIESRIACASPFAHMYIDLDHFKVFGDRYGYQAGSDVISWVGQVIRATVRELGTEQDLVGHIGGDDYVVLTTIEKAETIGRKVIERFDQGVGRFYSDEDRAAGCIAGKDRYGVEREFPLLSISIAVVMSDHLESVTLGKISEECARMKAHLKTLPGSNLLVDRRKG